MRDSVGTGDYRKGGAMKRTVGLVVLGLSLGLGLGTIAGNRSNAQPSPVTRTMLQQKDIEGMPGKEALVYVAEFTPGAASGRHFHPGPEVGYVLQGTLVLEPDGHAAHARGRRVVPQPVPARPQRPERERERAGEGCWSS